MNDATAAIVAALIGSAAAFFGAWYAVRAERRDRRMEVLREAYAEFFAAMHQGHALESFDAMKAILHQHQITEWRVRLLERDKKARTLIQKALDASNHPSASRWHQSMHEDPIPQGLKSALDELEAYVRQRD